MKWLRITLQILLPIAVILLAWWIGTKILAMKPAPTVEPTAFSGPIVRAYTAVATDVRVDVDAQGTVEPFRAIELASQVGGRVIQIAPALRAGGFFAADEVLVEIDSADYQLQVVQQDAAVARAELRLLQEKAEADAAVRAWQQLEGDRRADPLVVRGPQIRDAETALAATKAQLEHARLDIERTRLRAPFAGRVRSANVDVGKFVQPGQTLAHIYGVEAAEVRLPIPAGDAAFLDLPMHWNGAESRVGAQVDLLAEFAGQRHAYSGTIVRTEGEIDRKTRQLTVVARVEAPYAQSEQPDRPPLSVGMFVQARIHGRLFANVITLPRAALRGDSEVWVIDAEHRLRRRTVQVLRLRGDQVLLRSGLEPGSIVCTTNIDAPVEGMPVRLLPEEPR